jgi:hypothetical protein
MIHLLRAVAVVAAAAALAGLTYLVAGKVVAWRLPRSALAGLAAAAALTIWLATVRHAALVHSAAQPLSDGQKLSPGVILTDGFVGAFVVATAAVFVISAVAGARRGRRAARQAGSTAARRGRRTAVRGWGKA